MNTATRSPSGGQGDAGTAGGSLLIRGGRVLDPGLGLDEPADVLLADGEIVELGPAISAPEGGDVLDASGMIVVPGLIDLHVHLREPGFEYKEDIRSGAAAAVAGGFTTVCCMPNTRPVNDSRAVTDQITARAREVGLARVRPVAAVTRGLAGEELTEMGELRQAGAVAVSDDGEPVRSAGMMRRALQYAATFGLPVVNHCEELSLSRRAAVHEGDVSAWTGLRSQPSSAEEVMIARDLILCREAGARYHVAHVSTAESVALIRRAKAQGAPVTAEVTVHHLALTHEVNRGYDPNTKCNPPLRTEADRQACLEGVIDGTLDAIVTDHAPHATHEKAVEFEEAPFGVIGLETAVGVLLRLVEQGELEWPTLVRALTAGPARCFDLPGGRLEAGAPGDVTVIDPACAWTIQPVHFQSRSRNTPFAGWEVRGRAVATAVSGRLVYSWPEGIVR